MPRKGRVGKTTTTSAEQREYFRTIGLKISGKKTQKEYEESVECRRLTPEEIKKQYKPKKVQELIDQATKETGSWYIAN